MKVKVAVVQDSPAFFDKEKTIEKIQNLTQHCAAQACQLVVFPETFLPGYPRGFSFGTTVGRRANEGRQLFAAYHENSMDLESNDLKVLEEIAKSEGVRGRT